MQTTPQPRHRIAFRLLAIGLAALLGFIVAEIGLRLIFGPPLLPTPTGLMRADSKVGYRMRPNFDGAFVTPEFRTRIRTNSLGFRDDEWSTPGARSANDVAVLALGDSFAYGHGVEHEENFLTLVENRPTPSGGRIEILNAGHPGYGPAQDATLAAELIPQCKPRVALLFFFIGNDFADATRPLGGMVPYRGVLLFREQYERRSWTTPIKVFLRKRCKTYEVARDTMRRLLTDRKKRFALAFPDIDACRIAPTPAIESEGRLDAVRSALKSFKQVCERDNVTPALVIIPSRFQVSPGYRRRVLAASPLPAESFSTDYPNRVLREIAESLSMDVLDYLELLRDAPNSGSLYYERDQHWTPAGHRFAAQPLAEFITRNLESER